MRTEVESRRNGEGENSGIGGDCWTHVRLSQIVGPVGTLVAIKDAQNVAVGTRKYVAESNHLDDWQLTQFFKILKRHYSYPK